MFRSNTARVVLAGLMALFLASSPSGQECGNDGSMDVWLPYEPAPPLPEGVLPVVDLLVVYSGKARATQGGTEAIRATLQGWVRSTNAALFRSGSSARLRLAHAHEIEDLEDIYDMFEIQHGLIDPADNVADHVHDLREAVGADLISAVVDIPAGGGLQGLGAKMLEESVEFAESAFSTVKLQAGAFTHEIGHNFGLGHDAATDVALQPYAFGHLFVVGGNLFITIMSQSIGSGARIDHFSNPNVEFSGEPTGDAASADAVRNIEEVRDTVIQFRDQVVIDAALTERVSISTLGLEANGQSNDPAISADGRFVAFSTTASNLLQTFPGDGNGYRDIYVRDVVGGSTTRVSVDSSGGEADGNSFLPSISADGDLVAFSSDATNLVAGDTNASRDVFVHDRTTGITTRVSVSSTGAQASGSSYRAAISADGLCVAFDSNAADLVPADGNGVSDVFVFDRTTETIELVSVSGAGTQGTGESKRASISADGRHVAFDSVAEEFDADDAADGLDEKDVFVRDRLLASTTMLSKALNEMFSPVTGDDDSCKPTISADGRYVAFESIARNLVVAIDPGGTSQIYRRDRDPDDDGILDETGPIKLELVSSSGGPEAGDGESHGASISGDGLHVGFHSDATNLGGSDGNGETDVFVWTETGGPERVSISSDELEANGGPSIAASLDADGSTVAFASRATDLVPSDGNARRDVFVRRRRNSPFGSTTLVSTTVNKGTLLLGDPSTALDDADGDRARIRSVHVAASGEVIVRFTGVFETDLESLESLRVVFEHDIEPEALGILIVPDVVEAKLWDWSAAAWETVGTGGSGLLRREVLWSDATNPDRFLQNGRIKARIRAAASTTDPTRRFDMNMSWLELLAR